MANRDNPAEINYISIDELLIKKSEKPERRAHCQAFLPNSAADSLVKEGRVEVTLDRCFGNEDQDKRVISDFVRKNAKKVFLILSFMEEQGRWKKLQSGGLTFEDSCLPIRGRETSPEGDNRPQEGPWIATFTRSPKFWDFFFRDQWRFLAPTFRRSQFVYEFEYERRLPFVDIKDAKTYAGHFGSVFELGLRVDHTAEFPSSIMQPESNKGYVKVALKVTTVEHSASTDTNVEKFYNKEMTTLSLMRQLDHAHLIAAIAAYKKGHYRCFIFPWARGGSLKGFWECNSSKLDKTLVTWAIRQMSGISDGIKKLHNELVRHGDIKPLNILYFGDSNNHKSSALGNLMVADVGLAKVHETYTKDRVPGTTTRHGTNMYEPPEMAFFTIQNTKISKRYDIWSLGCIFLEFTIWLLYGAKGLSSFYRDLEASEIWRFWVPAANGHKLHEAVEVRIEEMEGQLDAKGALGRLVRLVSKKLLVGLDKRIDAKSLAEALRNIQKEYPVTSLSDLGPQVGILAEQRSRAGQGLGSPSNEVSLSDGN